MSDLLSAAQIAAMKVTANLALPGTAAITRATLSSDNMGGFTASWGAVATVDCRLDEPGSIRLDQWSEKIQNRSTYILNVAASADIQENDQATISGHVYDVVGLLSAVSWEITRRAVVVKL